MKILSEKQYRELIEESEDVAFKDMQMLISKWQKMDLLQLNCVKTSLCTLFSMSILLEKEGELNLKEFLADCMSEANQVVDSLLLKTQEDERH
jgi:hypothetical protein